MASFDLITFNSTTETKKKETSSGLTIDFSSIQIGASALAISESASSFSFNDNPIIDVTSIEIGATGLKISESSGEISINGNKLTGLAFPTADADAANKLYVDSVAQGLDIKAACVAIETGALAAVTAAGSGIGKTLTADASGLLTIDGVSTWTDMDNDGALNDPFPASGTPASRVLVAGQVDPVDNGIYAVKEKGDGGTSFILVRAVDFDEDSQVTSGAFTFIREGVANSDTGWALTTEDPIVVDVDPMTFTQFAGAGSAVGGDGIDVTGSVISVDLAATSGMEFATGKLQLDLAADGAGTGGLELSGNELQVTAGDGIELTASGVAVDLSAASGLEFSTGELQVDLEAAGAGAGGLSLNSNEIRVDAGNGIELTASGVSVNDDITSTTTTEANAINVSASGVNVKVDDSTLEGSGQGAAGTESLRVKDLGITTDKLAGTSVTAAKLGSDVAGNGLTGGNGSAIAALANVTETSTTESSSIVVAAGGISIAVDDSTLEGSGQGAAGAENLRVKAAGIAESHLNTSVAGNGITGGGGAALSVVANVTETSTTESSSIVVAAGGISIAVDDSTLEGSGQGAAGAENLRVKDAGITESHLNTSVAGDGLAGGGGTALSVNVGDGLSIVSDTVTADYTSALTNDNAGAITVGQIVYIKADGDVDLAQATVATLDESALGIVSDASIAAAASGGIITRRGAVVGGFSGLTPGKKQYVSRATAGDTAEALTGFVAGEFVYSVGRALSATEILFDPQFEFEF